MINILKERLQESSKGLQHQAIIFIGKFAETVGKDIKTHSKSLINLLILNLNIKEIQITKEVILALDRFGEVTGNDRIINTMTSCFKQQKCTRENFSRDKWVNLSIYQIFLCFLKILHIQKLHIKKM